MSVDGNSSKTSQDGSGSSGGYRGDYCSSDTTTTTNTCHDTGSPRSNEEEVEIDDDDDEETQNDNNDMSPMEADDIEDHGEGSNAVGIIRRHAHDHAHAHAHAHDMNSAQESSVCSISLSSESERLLSGLDVNMDINTLPDSSTARKEHKETAYHHCHRNYHNGGNGITMSSMMNEHDKYHIHLYQSYQSMFDLCRPHYFNYNEILNPHRSMVSMDNNDGKNQKSHSRPCTITFPIKRTSDNTAKAIQNKDQNNNGTNDGGVACGTTTSATGTSMSYSTQPSSTSNSNSASGSGSGNDNHGSGDGNTHSATSSNDGDENDVKQKQSFSLTLKRHLKQQHQCGSTQGHQQEQTQNRLSTMHDSTCSNKRICARGSTSSSSSDDSSLTVSSNEKRLHFQTDESNRGNSSQQVENTNDNDLGKPVRIEDVLSLSLVPRLVVQATHPYIVVHTNAAYSRLSGIDSIYAAGKPLSQILAIGCDNKSLTASKGVKDAPVLMRRSLSSFEEIVSNTNNLKETFEVNLLAIYRPSRSADSESSNKSSGRSSAQPVRMLCKMAVCPIVRDMNVFLDRSEFNNDCGDHNNDASKLNRPSSPSSVSSDLAVKERKPSPNHSSSASQRRKCIQVLTHYCLQFERAHNLSETSSASSSHPLKPVEGSPSNEVIEADVHGERSEGNENSDANDYHNHRMNVEENEGDDTNHHVTPTMTIG